MNWPGQPAISAAIPTSGFTASRRRAGNRLETDGRGDVLEAGVQGAGPMRTRIGHVAEQGPCFPVMARRVPIAIRIRNLAEQGRLPIVMAGRSPDHPPPPPKRRWPGAPSHDEQATNLTPGPSPTATLS